MNTDVIIIGAGTVGSAVGYGLASRGARVLVVDGADQDFRAATANFGLVWLHGKGLDMPAYQQLTYQSVRQWVDFASELTDVTGVDLQYENNGGLMLCLGEDDFEQRRATLTKLHNQSAGPDGPDWEMVDRTGLQKLLPGVELGADVSGASFGRHDGHANPLQLLSALHQGLIRKGGALRGNSPVRSILAHPGGGFTVDCGAWSASASRLVIAAGIGSPTLAAQVGLNVSVRPQRGQIIVTERLAPLLPLPTLDVRQTREGTMMIGATHEEAGLDTGTSFEAASALGAAAVRQFPALGEVRLVRQWAGLRILTPDAFPIYAESPTHPGAFVALCHSGVTLAAIHAGMIAEAIADGHLPQTLDFFHHRRFDVS